MVAPYRNFSLLTLLIFITSASLSLHIFQGDVHAVDPRGRTALHLAVTLGHLESVRILLRHNAQVNVENKGGWNGNFLSFLVVLLINVPITSGSYFMALPTAKVCLFLSISNNVFINYCVTVIFNFLYIFIHSF